MAYHTFFTLDHLYRWSFQHSPLLFSWPPIILCFSVAQLPNLIVMFQDATNNCICSTDEISNTHPLDHHHMGLLQSSWVYQPIEPATFLTASSPPYPGYSPGTIFGIASLNIHWLCHLPLYFSRKIKPWLNLACQLTLVSKKHGLHWDFKYDNKSQLGSVTLHSLISLVNLLSHSPKQLFLILPLLLTLNTFSWLSFS